MIVQYARFVGGILHGDLGDSALGDFSARDLVVKRIGVSLQLVVPAFILGLGIAIPLGSIAAVKRGAIGAVAMMLALIFHSVPSFFLGVLFIFLFGVTLDWLPVYGSGGVEHFILPVAALMAYPLARYTRLIRAQVAETLTQAYVQTARAKGLAETRVLRRHVLRIALLPIVTVMGVDIGTLVVDGGRRRGGLRMARLRCDGRRGGGVPRLPHHAGGEPHHRAAGAHQQSGCGLCARSDRPAHSPDELDPMERVVPVH